MTSESEAIKTNEFLRRRKLRLQQVREQSKDIAKKIRQRAKVEKLRQVVDLDAKKQKDYFECQERLVKRLEVLYARGLEKVGAGHQGASEVKQQDEAVKVDLSKLRGKEATAELRRKRQEKLDQQKKVLDRKLLAREVANEISRDKTSAVANNLFSKSTSIKAFDNDSQKPVSSTELANVIECNQDAEIGSKDPEGVKTNDMATQWEMENIPKEWEPAVPALSLPSDKDTPKVTEESSGSKVDKTKRLDLFALSKDMPSSLRSKHTHETRERDTSRPSLTLVSEYLQSRKLRLRETETANTNKKPTDDIPSLKQTILRTRHAAKAEGSPYNVCTVLDEQIFPVPTWQAEGSCQFCSNNEYCPTPVPSRQFKNVTNSQINQIFKSIRPSRQSDLLPSPVLRGTSPFRRSKVLPSSYLGKGKVPINNYEKPKVSQDIAINRKSSVLMYNHSTRDTRDLPCAENNLVVRDFQSEEDAYSQAMKEVSFVRPKEKDHQKKVQDMRNKVAVTKQNVEKEYKDTMNFLNALPKDKNSKFIKNAYMDERCHQMQQENRQQKMQQEFRKIERECRRHQCTKSRSKSRSPPKQDLDDNFESKDFQYSWMPVPESDGNLAIHAIPNTVKQGKSGNTVKFSQVDSYHEYRSRHKHTPPTKDTGHTPKKVVETVIIDKNTTDSSDTSSITSDTSSVENLKIDKESNKSKNVKKINENLSDAERIIIYKVLDSKTGKKSKTQIKLLNEIAKSLTCIEKVQKTVIANDGDQVKNHQNINYRSTSKNADNAVSFEQLDEGVYKMAEEQGDNLASMYFTENITDAKTNEYHCKHPSRQQERDKGTILHWESGDCLPPARTPIDCQCPIISKDKAKEPPPSIPPSTAAPSSTSFTTATNDKSATTDGGYIKLVDQTGHEAGQFFLGAKEFLNNNSAFEVVIQLRKRDGTTEEIKLGDNKDSGHNKESNDEINKNNEPVTRSETDMNDPQTDSNRSHDVLYKTVSEDEPTMVPAQKSPHDIADAVVMPDKVMDIKLTSNGVETSPKSSDKVCFIQPEKKDMCDKAVGVHTYFNDTSKLDPIPRPATTTCTQTTLSSPIHRPVFFHMSSSTSTAYMSPPELILPKFFRRDHVTTEDEMYDPMQTIEITEKVYCDQYTSCCCRKCKHARKKRLSKKLPEQCGKENNKTVLTPTPPNTQRSPSERHRHEGYFDLYDRKVATPSKSARIDKTKCIHRGKDEFVKKHCHKNKKPSENTGSSRNINMNAGTISSRYRCKPTSYSHDKKLSKPNLNPIIKTYINKLLALNTEGLKAVEVADQECSSVGTPSSSIINVPYNVDERKPLMTTISLEQIKKMLKRQIIEEHLANKLNCSKNSLNYVSTSKNNLKLSTRTSRKKQIHKVKSLNISKKLIKKNNLGEVKPHKSASPSSTDDNVKRIFIPTRPTRSRSSPTPRQVYTSSRFNDTDSTAKYSTATEKTDDYKNRPVMNGKQKSPPLLVKQPDFKSDEPQLPNAQKISPPTPDSESTLELHGYKQKTRHVPVSMATQTRQNVDDTNFMKLAEDKLQNMEKIADLTEKCTKRLSNLAKVLEEVRKNKSLAYSQISSAESIDSQSDHKSDKNVSPVPGDSNNIPQILEIKSPQPVLEEKNIVEVEKSEPSEYIPALTDITKPDFNPTEPILISPPKLSDKVDSPLHYAVELLNKSRPKPPPALSRLHFKHGQDHIIPHELSTVIEVDSPMSVKFKTHTSRNDAKEVSNNSNISSVEDKEPIDEKTKNVKDKDSGINPDLLQSNTNFSKKFRLSSTESSDESKFQMIDLKQFNEIMLEPFISIQEYAKQYNMEPPDEGSNLEDMQRDDGINDDMSSLHSDGSLPDVIAELLKRNVITEPFKFDTASNINSTTVSSESTLSMLALSKVRKDRKRSRIIFQNKENIGETSDTLSISSNPDLENAFKKLGMGWASSTLKKTKERLALSSSSNTSSSSISQFKTKNVNQDIPALVTDSVTSATKLSKKGTQSKHVLEKVENSKSVEQQTTLSNSMTVKEFLRNELAKKITFNNKSSMNNTEEFVSLFETKMPEEMKESSQVNCDERSIDSAPSGAIRARTSTPVQIFKSMTFHSSSSSNISNGLFSNADDLSSVKLTSNSMKNHSTSDKDDLTIPNFSLRMKKSDCSKSD